ncbi:hypothetical protein JCM3770_003392 [Rhodotorula araucariae]
MASRHLLNPLAPLGLPTPSALDGISDELERDLRAYGALLIQQAGILLKASQVVMATAQVLFQRFWFVTSLKHFGIRDVGMGALFLASKLEEAPLRIRDIVNCYSYLDSLVTYCSKAPYPPASSYESYAPMDYFATEFYDLKDAMVIAEMQILKRLGFQTQSGLPYGHLVNYLQVLELAGENDLVRRCWGFCNDMLQTAAPALYPQGTLALAAIYLATRLSTPPIALPLAPVPWWTHFDTTEDEIVDVATMLLRLYAQWGSDPRQVGAVADGQGEERESVWKRAGRIPVTKAGVRELLARDGVGNEPLFGGSVPWPSFTAVNDTLRGGASTSSLSVDPVFNSATFSGNLDITALGGAGFASQSTLFPSRLSLPRSKHAGLLLTFLPPVSSPTTSAGSPGPVTRFVVALKTSEPARRPDGRRESVTVYEYTFSASDTPDELASPAGDEEKGARSITLLARWGDFKPTYRGRPAPDAAVLDPAQIYELSFMARSHFGEQAGEFALEILTVSAAAPERRRGWLGTVWGVLVGLWARWVASAQTFWCGRAKGAVRLP